MIQYTLLLSTCITFSLSAMHVRRNLLDEFNAAGDSISSVVLPLTSPSFPSNAINHGSIPEFAEETEDHQRVSREWIAREKFSRAMRRYNEVRDTHKKNISYNEEATALKQLIDAYDASTDNGKILHNRDLKSYFTYHKIQIQHEKPICQLLLRLGLLRIAEKSAISLLTKL